MCFLAGCEMYPRIGSDWDLVKQHINKKQTFFHEKSFAHRTLLCARRFLSKINQIDENNALYLNGLFFAHSTL